MIKKTLFLSFFFLLIYSSGFSQNAQELYRKAQESFDKARYEESLLYLKNCEKVVGSNPKIQSMKILCYNYLGDLKQTKIALIGYFKMISPEYEVMQAHQNLIELNQRIDAQIDALDKENNRLAEKEKRETANQYTQRVNAEMNLKKENLKSASKSTFSKLLNQNASADLKSKMGSNAKELEVLGVNPNDYQKSKLTLREGVYTGELSNGIPSGNGVMNYTNGDKYEGQWGNGRKHGQGKYIFANNNFYEGQWNEDNTSGEGKFIKTNGDYGIGTFKDSYVLVSGRVKTTLPTGANYEGDFLNGEYTGNAEIKYMDGNRYTGSVKNGLKDGSGTLYLYNGNWITGVWSQDKKENGRKHYLQKVRLGTGYLGITYAGLQPVQNLSAPSAPLQLSFDGGYLGRWFNVGGNLGYFKQPAFLRLNGQNKQNDYGNVYLGINAGPNFAILKDHIILKLNYQFGFVPRKISQVDNDDMLANKIIYVKSILVNDYQAELIFRWGQTAYGVFYKYSTFKNRNSNPEPGTEFTTIDLPNQNGIIGFKFIALFSN